MGTGNGLHINQVWDSYAKARLILIKLPADGLISAQLAGVQPAIADNFRVTGKRSTSNHLVLKH